MGARRDLGNDAAIGTMLFQLAQHHVAENPAAALFVTQHDRSGGFVAACLNAEDAQRRGRHVLYSKIAVAVKGGYTKLKQRRAPSDAQGTL